MSEIYLARQPIFSTDFKLHGYELLYRDGDTIAADFESEDEATSQVFLAALVDIGLENLSANCPAYINISREYLDGMAAVPMLPDDVALEIAADDCADNGRDKELALLKAKGYTLVCDHFKSDLLADKTLGYFSEVKCNVNQLDSKQLKLAVSQAKEHGCQLVATHVEDYQNIPQLIELGFDFYQGFFLSKPQVQHQGVVPTNLLPVVQTLSRLLDPAMQLQELSAIISSDVSLSYRVLRLIKSAHYSVNNIESIAHAIVYLGRDAIKNLLITILLSRVEEKPAELTRLALVRAKMCELMARHVQLEDMHCFFTLGLLSVLDAMLDMPMETVVTQLPIGDELKLALVDKEGVLGQTLQCVLEYEECRLYEINQPHVPTAELNDFYIQAVAWADDAFQGFTLEG